MIILENAVYDSKTLYGEWVIILYNTIYYYLILYIILYNNDLYHILLYNIRYNTYYNTI